MSGKAILITGYPGSGKSTYGKKLRAAIDATRFVDDYHRDSLDDRPLFDHGREYTCMIDGLTRGETWIASDIAWCSPDKRVEVETALQDRVPDVEIEWHFISCDEDVCRERVRERSRKKAESELKMIDELSTEYNIPTGSRVILCEGQ